jgi:hypothetical protein
MLTKSLEGRRVQQTIKATDVEMFRERRPNQIDGRVEFFENKVGGITGYDVANASGRQREKVEVGTRDRKNGGE